MNRSATVSRKTKETVIEAKLNLDGQGHSAIDTGVPFFDHMLTLMSTHGFFDLTLQAKGDTEIGEEKIQKWGGLSQTTPQFDQFPMLRGFWNKCKGEVSLSDQVRLWSFLRGVKSKGRHPGEQRGREISSRNMVLKA